MTFWEAFANTLAVMVYLVWFFGTMAGLIASLISMFEDKPKKANVIGLCVSILSGMAFISQLRVLVSQAKP